VSEHSRSRIEAQKYNAESKRYAMKESNGALVAYHIRKEEQDGGKRFFWQRPGSPKPIA
jgi:hypothetical protein